MATESTGRYPYIPEKYWWALRKRFATSIPKTVTADYLCTILDVSEASARAMIRSLQACGLIDEDGVPTDEANEWRHDDTYPNACAKIFSSVYPVELRDAVPPPAIDRAAAER